MQVSNPDSIDKIREFIRLSNREKVVLSPMYFRKYSCPENCGGCCKGNVTIDFISSRWDRFKKLYPEKVHLFKTRFIDGVEVHSTQLRSHQHYCQFLDTKNGRCTIHQCVPFSCEFVLSKFIDNKALNRSILTTTYYGRKHTFKCVDGTMGAKCQCLDFSQAKFERDLELLKELNEYAQLWNEQTKLPEIIRFLETEQIPIKITITF